MIDMTGNDPRGSPIRGFKNKDWGNLKIIYDINADNI